MEVITIDIVVSIVVGIFVGIVLALLFKTLKWGKKKKDAIWEAYRKKSRAKHSKSLNDKTFEEVKILADQGDGDAQCDLGIRYSTGKYGALKKDAEGAIKYFILAAEQGHFFGQYNLIISYIDVLQLNLAYMWTNILILNPDKEFEDIEQLRDILEKKMTVPQLKEVKEIVRTWKPNNYLPKD